MNKLNLLKFIELYNLNGTIERVKLESDGKSIKTGIVADDRTMAGSVKFNDLKVEKGEYGIHDTAQLKKMLGILEDEVEVAVNKLDDGRAISLAVSDKNTESLIVLADMSVIPKVPTVNNVGSFDLEIELTDEFVERFVKAKNALPDVTAFTLGLNKKGDKVELIIGDGDTNTNRIKLEVSPVVGKDKPAKEISFNANYFKEILLKNKGATGSVLKVNSAGLANVAFKTAEYEANYYLIKINK
jgi:hypothetical protein